MNTVRIRQAAQEIDRLSSALSWLKEHGGVLDPRSKDAFGVNVAINHASALPGSKEAAGQLSAIAKLHIREIVEDAIRDAENTIEMHRSALREECA